MTPTAGTERLANDPTEAILADGRHLVHSFADLHALGADGARSVIVEGRGAHVFDARGTRYLDGTAGLWCVNVGHGRREIAEAVREQLETLDYFSTFYQYVHPTAAALARRLAELAPAHLNRVHFGNSGSVANDTAVRTLHYYFNRLGRPRKKKILSRIGAYHGSTHLSVAMTTPDYRAGWDSADELVHFLACPCPYYRPDGMGEAEFGDFLIEDMRRDIEKVGPERIAAFIAEPVLGAGGVMVPPAGYHRRAEALCREYDILTISDEVVTAFGRLGHAFASEDAFGLAPDVLCVAKGLTSGYQPLSATLLSDAIHEVVAGEGAKFLHGTTYSGHPACCAAALANLDILEREDLCGHVRRIGPRFEAALGALGDLPTVGDVRGSHLMMAIEFARDPATRERFDVSLGVPARVAEHARRRGAIVRPIAHAIVMSPPLVIDEGWIDELVGTLRESIEATAAELAAEGALGGTGGATARIPAPTAA